MYRSTSILCAALLVVGCAPNEEPKGLAPGEMAATRGQGEVSVDDRFSLGRDTYLAACADCHDESSDVAPRLGDADAWSNRSPLWQSVLTEHAEDGYLQMPAKGGRGELSDEAVAAAVEYMVTWSQPDRRPSE